jgi:hypothetical protein
VPNPGISGFQPDKRQMRRTLLVRPGHRRLRHQKSACGARADRLKLMNKRLGARGTYGLS